MIEIGAPPLERLAGLTAKVNAQRKLPRKRLKRRRGPRAVRGTHKGEKLEKLYNAALQRLLARVYADIEALLFPAIKALEPAYVADSYITDFESLFAQIKSRWDPTQIRPPAHQLIEQMAGVVTASEWEMWKRNMESELGIDFDRDLGYDYQIWLYAKMRELNRKRGRDFNPVWVLLSGWVLLNTNLVVQLVEHFLARVENIVYSTTMQGLNSRSIIDQVKGQIGVESRKARNTSRDQIQNFLGQMNRLRQGKMGVTAYRWQTKQDHLVRCDHREAQGKVFLWAKPPALGPGHPKEPMNCRCWAIPLIEGVNWDGKGVYQDGNYDAV
jgi:SPP1 gp7 family putative phage head morphogenesis protein